MINLKVTVDVLVSILIQSGQFKQSQTLRHAEGEGDMKTSNYKNYVLSLVTIQAMSWFDSADFQSTSEANWQNRENMWRYMQACAFSAPV